MNGSERKHVDSFKDAWSGLVWAVRTQPNFRIHLILSIAAILLSVFLQVSFVESTIIVFMIILGLSVEMLNTSVESMTDLITTEYRKDAKIAKDVAAGMMLLTAVGAVVIAFLIFGPHILEYFSIL